MKRLQLSLYMALVCIGLQAHEEEQGEQLLVFRNTGVVDLLYTQEVDSILTTDSTQVFYAKDTTLIVPFAELDSVAVGSRNEMKFHKGVRELTAQDDLPWIIRFDGQSVYYRLTTPTNILPSVGTKLFYKIEDHMNERTIFPFGLSVKVTNVTTLSEEIRVDVEVVPLNEIFERLFFAGSFSGSQPVAASVKQNSRRTPVHATLELGHFLPLREMSLTASLWEPFTLNRKNLQSLRHSIPKEHFLQPSSKRIWRVTPCVPSSIMPAIPSVLHL